jgi:hypothetical protein
MDKKQNHTGFSGLSDLTSEITPIEESIADAKPAEPIGSTLSIQGRTAPLQSDINNNGQKGFSGLEELTSRINAINDPVKSEPDIGIKPSTPKQPPLPQRAAAPAEPERITTSFPPPIDPVKSEPDIGIKPSTPKQPPLPQRAAAPAEPERITTSFPPPIETASSGKSDAGSGGKWFLGIIVVIFVIWLMSSGYKNNKDLPYSPTPSQSNSYSQSSSVSSSQTPRTPQNAEPGYKMPSVGTNNVLSIQEIRWCIRSLIRIEAMRGVINTNYGIDAFNRIVNDYNSRCERYQYRESAQSQAERDVEACRSQIISEAIIDARQLGYYSQAASFPVSTSASSESKYDYGSSALSSSLIPSNLSTITNQNEPNAKDTKEVQRLLTDLGYNTGPIDGKFGHKTAETIMAFQRDMGSFQDGRIDTNLLVLLRKTSKLKQKNVEMNTRDSQKTNTVIMECGEGFAPTRKGGCTPVF